MWPASGWEGTVKQAGSHCNHVSGPSSCLQGLSASWALSSLWDHYSEWLEFPCGARSQLYPLPYPGNLRWSRASMTWPWAVTDPHGRRLHLRVHGLSTESGTDQAHILSVCHLAFLMQHHGCGRKLLTVPRPQVTEQAFVHHGSWLLAQSLLASIVRVPSLAWFSEACKV